MANQVVPYEMSPEATQAFRSFTPKQQAFVEAYQRTGNGNESYRQAYNASNMSPVAISVEVNRLMKHPSIALVIADQVEAARAYAQSLAAQSIERLSTIAEVSEDATAARLAVSERANARILEAAGVLRTGQGVTVNIDNRSIDGMALEMWQARNTPNATETT